MMFKLLFLIELPSPGPSIFWADYPRSSPSNFPQISGLEISGPAIS
jgi:hypothetical protein